MKLSKPKEYIEILLQDLVSSVQILTGHEFRGVDDPYEVRRKIQEKFMAVNQEIQGILEDQKMYVGEK